VHLKLKVERFNEIPQQQKIAATPKNMWPAHKKLWPRPQNYFGPPLLKSWLTPWWEWMKKDESWKTFKLQRNRFGWMWDSQTEPLCILLFLPATFSCQHFFRLIWALTIVESLYRKISGVQFRCFLCIYY
jgi:hypothetical protein